MKSFSQGLSIQTIHLITKGELLINQDVLITNIADPVEANSQSVIFFENEKYSDIAINSNAGLIITKPAFTDLLKDKISNVIVVDNPYQSVLYLMHYWLEAEKPKFETFIHPTAVIGSNVSLAEHVQIGAFVTIESGSEIGDFTIIKPHCSIGHDVKIGNHCLLHPGVSVYNECSIGSYVVIHSGAVIGSDGFGYLLLQGSQHKIPQIGSVVINDNVEIGANTTIDRGTISPTVIGEGTKIDNLVQIGHNCIIGKHSILCAQVGLAGSSKIGDYVYLAGQVGLAGHLNIGDNTMIGAQSGVASDLPANGKFFGTPAREAQRMKRIMAVESNLPEMYKFYNQLKRDKEREQV